MNLGVYLVKQPEFHNAKGMEVWVLKRDYSLLVSRFWPIPCCYRNNLSG